ncbi:F-box/WD repeat-containing protein 5-like, partial [Spodoptera litura]|uniref:F-box/WD repeat-containing protein 5-like n=1 Tax=Spodoptera litura TaxID=69820 RepID=A0A9J7EVD6_SPOLT
MSVWQSEEQRCAVVLREVLAWLAGADVARCGAVCRAWRRATDDPALWRRLLRRESLLPLPREARWRQEYVRAHAGWRLAARHGAGASVLHGALGAGHGGTRLAVGCADASVAVWARGPCGWVERGRSALRGRGWAAVARVQWPAVGAARLLVAGPLTLVHDWELLVLSVEEDGSLGAVASRVRCSAGAAGCWADTLGHTFCSLELRRLGPGLYCTTVWLNAATQETESEYEGVTSPMLRIYNEESQHLTHAVVTRSEPRLLGAGGGRQLVAGGGRRLGAWR